ncbi:DUF5677 domain-containing protein [Aneurinibacillus migulanus]|uniref:DUF5677 domain-containing protein n=1 Tax=Aneurinibacillus migulanus TaxID=47500 RepID=UPI0020A1DE58|nr:DUF5677 domain-containing protein [Aneurinibacillus migulanus]MCP1355453.1 DUF5677 domain-containing protein [Aneurinibacillus migulanus]
MKKMDREEFIIVMSLIFEQIESSKRFEEIKESHIGLIFYHLYIKCKRLYITINNVMDAKFSNSYVEAIPLIRTLMDSYFHISFITNEKDHKKIIEAYDWLIKSDMKKTASRMKHSEELADLEKKFIESTNLELEVPKEFKFITSTRGLAKETENLHFYRKYYGLLSAFVHFNPLAFHNYGTVVDGVFFFNQQEENDERELEVRKLFDKLSILFIADIVKLLDTEDSLSELNALINMYERGYKNGIRH